ncbi:leucine-rich repeat domain-containing protein [Candidatus Saccharibacteria bacterium]|nr:leucine-rich repeat domain-containing protein [Candidatus Saccharibacteria bacterium]
MLKNKKVACLVFLAALFVGGGGLLIRDFSYAEEFGEFEVQTKSGFNDMDLYECVEGAYIEQEQPTMININGLSENQLAVITELECTDKEIEDLTGLNQLTGLNHLNLSGNKIKEIDLSPYQDLQILELSGNEITSIDVSKNAKLEHLMLSQNKITSIDVSKNANLEQLNLDYNGGLESISLPNSRKLGILSLKSNKLGELISADKLSAELAKVPSLYNLDLSINSLASIDVSKNTNLRTLELYGNRLLTLVDVSDNTLLGDLRVDDIFVRTNLPYEVSGNSVVFNFDSVLFVNNGTRLGNNIIKDVEGVMTYVREDRRLVVTDLSKTNGYAQTVGEENQYTNYKVLLSTLTHVVSLDHNNGTGVIDRLVCVLDSTDAESCSVTLPEGPSRDGYKFAGWSDGTNTMKAGDKIAVSRDITLKADWKTGGGGNNGGNGNNNGGNNNGGNKENENSSKKDKVAVPNTGRNTNNGENSILFVIISLPIAALITGVAIYINNIKKAHKKFD